ncbi:D-alanyl-D-alanine carboxypeptidase family protein [Kitasatospora sp. NPDC050543]|uniref:D-alanyl-D-alanine carboxypeptidase family protein n=1 Tax=Kitasatospora sp. NPDC050543 TaxID=3364054 RepID=UPI0037A220BB
MQLLRPFRVLTPVAIALIPLAPGPAVAAHGAASAPDAVSTVGGERLARSGVQVAPLAGAPALPTALTGLSWLVADAGTGEVLASQNAHLRLPPASTMKMLFADTLIPRLDKTAIHQVDPSELAGLGAGSSLVGVKEGLGYRVEDLWRGVFLSSGNDAVHVLAHMNGGIPTTVAQMQARADALQAHDTHVVTPDGYDEEGQVSSAYDLTLFARAGLHNQDFRMYCGTRTAQFPGAIDKTTGRRTSYDIANTDRLLGNYPGLIGVKNGYTTNAGATFTGAAERGGRTLLVTLMHTESNQVVYDEAAALLDWGFAAAGKVAPVGRLVEEPAPAEADRPFEQTGPPEVALPQPVGGETGAAGWLVITLGGVAVAVAVVRALVRQRRRPAPAWSSAGTGVSAGAGVTAGAAGTAAPGRPVGAPVRAGVGAPARGPVGATAVGRRRVVPVGRRPIRRVRVLVGAARRRLRRPGRHSPRRR